VLWVAWRRAHRAPGATIDAYFATKCRPASALMGSFGL